MSPRGVDLDIIETIPPEWTDGVSTIVPTDIVINGISVLVPKDSEIQVRVSGYDVVTATLTLMVRQLRVHAEAPAPVGDSPLYESTCYLFDWNPLEVSA